MKKSISKKESTEDKTPENYNKISSKNRTPRRKSKEETPINKSKKSNDRISNRSSSEKKWVEKRTPNKEQILEQNQSPDINKSKSRLTNKKKHYEAFIDVKNAEEGLLNKTLFQGAIRINPHNRSDAYVTAGLERDIYIPGLKARNRAFEGDIVVVQLYDKSKWKVLGNNEDEENNQEEIPPLEDNVSEKASEEEDSSSIQSDLDNSFENLTLSSTSRKEKQEETCSNQELQPTGHVVYIKESKHVLEQVGWLRPINGTEVKPKDRFALFVPTIIQHPQVLIPIGQIPDFYRSHKTYEAKLVVIEIIEWREDSKLPIGTYKRILGELGEIEPETEALLMMNKVDYREFSQTVLDSIPTSIPIEQEIKNRRDLRSWRIFTIDPPTARDLDDAISITKLSDEKFEVGVHIADVSFFVQPGTAVDREAQRRSTSVYLVQKVIPMLPNILCENLCSLNPGEDRFAFSVIWTLDVKGNILFEWFGKTIIRSCSKLPYSVAQDAIEGKLTDSWLEEHKNTFPFLGPWGNHKIKDIIQDIKDLWIIAKSLRDSRFEGGAISMNNIKIGFQLNEFGNPITSFEYITKESNHLIEEYAILANMQVAKRISKYFPDISLLRNHVAPMENKLENFQKFCTDIGKSVDVSSSKSLSESLKHFKETESPLIFAALQTLATRPLQLAKYFCTGDLDFKMWKHFALNINYYTHFTSPIRRYPDIVVHRLLESTFIVDQQLSAEQLSKELSHLPTKDQVSKIAEIANEKKYNAKKAQEASDRLFLTLLLKSKPVVTDAVVIQVLDRRIIVLIGLYGLERKIYLEDHIINSSKHDAKKNQLIIYWPETPNLKSEGSIEQIISIFSLVKVKIETKDQDRSDLKANLLHPQEIQVYKPFEISTLSIHTTIETEQLDKIESDF